ncbi:TetR/AcrR family transcriptional regulator [Zavarzinia compransoris]|uniref:HTH tetR-type domain-containing protein n=1 Tax=Zavarzinia compransoris TaxID=1264899 RepID=A0A317E373_9PROT|nr:TetR/AcrR family transcriptional regulator [Zavarzinia compransoris]PWR20620.1 hypothetical protein DKG75_11480 [Zavarzinia compransoris]TDP44564.1 TetR family transcriptional regulator [Zavarzinia compransoris]
MAEGSGRRMAPSRGRSVLRAKSALTRDRIADVALTLFNAQGYTAVTTNRIADDCGISPGNLYYHFRNREDILWYLFEGVEKRIHRLFLDPAFTETGVDRLRLQIMGAAEILAEFRFFFHDHIAIMRRDPRVEASYRGLQRDVTRAVARDLQPLTGEDGEQSFRLASSLWIVATGWVSFLEVQGTAVDPVSILSLVDAVLDLVRPRIRPAA